MKRNLLLLTLVLMLFGSLAHGQENKTQLEVIYFHATRRCATCNAIEENTKKTLDTWFKDQLKTGIIKFSVINVDEEKNEALAEKYEATGSSLFITKKTGGKETRTDMTEFAFSWARNNPDKFMKGLKDKINSLLK